jgi:hypothetical protein
MRGDYREVRQADVALVHSWMHRDALGSSPDAGVNRAYEIRIVSPS